MWIGVEPDPHTEKKGFLNMRIKLSAFATVLFLFAGLFLAGHVAGQKNDDAKKADKQEAKAADKKDAKKADKQVAKAADKKEAKKADKQDAKMAPSKAVAVLHPTEGNTVSGTITFTREGNAVKVVADLTGLKPGTHGFHIHEFGDCSARDGMSAGGHFNPASMPHGAPADKQRHAGDLGNIEANQDGKAHLEIADSVLKLDGAGSILGRGVIVHAAPDDLKTQPTGNAGGRQACGVIGIAKP